MANESNSCKELSSTICFGGQVKQYQHESKVLGCEMKFSVFVPPTEDASKAPVLYYLSGLTCTDQNFITKAGAQRVAATLGIAFVCPDTSPRGLKIEGEDESWDFGTGAGFYLNATQEPWKKNYRMYDYVMQELPQVISEIGLPIDPTTCSIFGHSMGGHGALICALRNPGHFKSVSAFAPICNPSNCPWGKKAFSGYLGDNQEEWKAYDATELVGKYSGNALSILIDQGTKDNFHCRDHQLLPQVFEEAAKPNKDIDLQLRFQEGYDHSYYFIATFIEDHLRHHAKYLFL